MAGMLYSLVFDLVEWTLDESLAFANELAGRKVIQEGFGGLGAAVKSSDRWTGRWPR